MKQIKRILSYICLAAMLLSYMVFPAAAAETAPASQAAFLGIDKATGGANWEGNYGVTQTMLPGRLYDGDPSTSWKKTEVADGVTIARHGVSKYLDQVIWRSDVSNTSIFNTTYPTQPQWMMKLESGMTPALALPSSYATEYAGILATQSQYDTYYINQGAKECPNAPASGFVMQDGHYYTMHRFIRMTNGQTYRFAMFSDNRYLLDGYVNVYIYDKATDGNLIQTVQLQMEDFTGGGYANFLVTPTNGELYVIVERSALTFGVNGFFFDAVTAGDSFASGLTATANVAAGSATLTWNEADGASGNVTIARAESENGEYTVIASVPAGTKTYTDTGLENGKTYYYKICTTNKTNASAFTDAVACEMAEAPVVEYPNADPAVFLGIDKLTGGANWEGNYGLTQTMLPGRLFDGDPSVEWKKQESVTTADGSVTLTRHGVDDKYLDQVVWLSNTAGDAILNASHPNKCQWFMVLEDGMTPALALPSNYATQHAGIYETQKLYDTYYINQGAKEAPSAFNSGYTSFAQSEMKAGNYYTMHRFTRMVSGQTYRFSLFSDNRYQLDGTVTVYFYDKAVGGTLQQKVTLQMSDFNGGGYANFLVTTETGELYIVVERSALTFGINGFFFDAVTAGEGFVSGLTAEKVEAKSVKLTWNEAANASGNVTIARAESEDGEYTTIAGIPAGTKTYTDTGLSTGKTYYYKLVVVDKNNFSAYTDPVACELPHVFEAPELVIYTGLDKTTGGLNWEGNYGAAQTVLPGLLIDTNAAPTDYTMKYPFVCADGSNGTTDIYFKSGSNLSSLDYHSDTAEGAITCVSAPGGERMYFPYSNTNGQAIALPTALANSVPEWLKSHNAAFMRGHKVAYSYSDPIVPLGENDSRTIHEFNLPENKYYQLAIFSNNWYNQAGSVTFHFIKDDVVVQQQTVDMQEFNGGTYVTFLVKGDFKLYIDKTSDYFGISGFFFDEMNAENFTDSLTVANVENRDVTLTWNETDAPANSKVIVVRANREDGQYKIIGIVDAGVCTYTDLGVSAGKSLSYRLLVLTADEYSEVHTEAVHSVEYEATSLSFNAESYTALDSAEDVTVQVTLKDSEGNPCAGKEVALIIEWAIAALEPQQIDAVVTDENGVATFVFKAEYLGDATIVASFADDDVDQLLAASATADLFIGGAVWEAPALIWKISDAIKPGDTIGIYGHALKRADGSAPTVKIARHGTSDVKTVEVLQYDYEDGLYCMVILPIQYEPGLYDIWVDNGYGNSEAALLNAVRPLFISDYEAWAGQSIVISGRALAGESFGAKNATLVRLVNGGASYNQKITKLTPYSITFAITAETPVGTYTVEVSNDNGATWMAMQSEQTLDVVAVGKDPLNLGVAWMDDFAWDKVYNVAPSGADDTAAMNAALATAHANGGGVVQLNAGTYYVSGMINIKENTVLMGAGKNETNIVYNGENQAIILFNATNSVGNIGFAKFNVSLADPNKRVDSFFWIGHDWSAAYAMEKRTADQFFLYDVKVVSGDTDYTLNTPNNVRGMSCVFLVDQRLLVQGCEFSGYNMGWSNTKTTEYVTVRDTHWYLTKGNIFTPARYTFILDSSVTGIFQSKADNEYGNAEDTHGFSVRAYSHIEDSVVSNVGARLKGFDGSAAANDGESFMFEAQDHADFGVVVNATATTLAVYPNDGKFDEMIPSSTCNIYNWNRVAVLITEGRGVGQIRTIMDIDYENMVLTVDEPWDVLPDSTSRFIIYNPTELVTFYNNTDRDCAKGVYLYGNGFDVVVANHNSTNTEGIIVNNQQWSGSGARCWAGYYIDIRDNSITGVSARCEDSKIAIINGRSVDGEGYHYSVSAIGVEIRNNTMKNGRTEAYNYFAAAETEGMFGTGIYLRCGVGNKDGVDTDSIGVIIENNDIQDQYHAIHYTISVRGLLLKDNKITNCTVAEGKVAMSDLEKEETSVVKQIVRYTSPAVVATVNGSVYSTLEEALEAASFGDTVKLLANAEVSELVLTQGVTLDLNGYELDAEYVVAFAGNAVIDSLGDGLLKSRNVRLAADNAQMPVWVEDDDGYRFFTMKDSQLYYTQSATGFVFIAKPVLGKAANAPYMALANNGLSVKARMSWKSAGGNDVEQFFVLKGEDVQSIYSDKNQIIQLTVNGAGSYIGRLSTTMVIESETGVIWAGVPLLYTGN